MIAGVKATERATRVGRVAKFSISCILLARGTTAREREDEIKRTGLLISILLGLALFIGAHPAAAQTVTAWQGAYFANRTLQGNPAFTRADAAIDFNWSAGSPGGGIAPGDFSVRWTRWVYIDTPGNWTFTMITDDGARLFLDEALVLDAWNDQPATAHSVTLNLTQAFHLVRMEYYNHGGVAEAHLEMLSAAFPDWRGEYFSNPDLVGTPAFTRNDSAINFNFGTAGPGGGVAGTNFSARWTRSLNLTAGKYRFTTTTDDGVRLWVDNQLLIDQWHDQTAKSWTRDVTLGAGNHWIKMEYFQHGAEALAQLAWALAPGSADVWHGEFFSNPGLEGNAAFSRDDADINFDWGTGSPGKGIASPNNWSARWTAKRTTATAGFYTVSAVVDDGVRIWVDGQNIIDEWHDQSPTPLAATVFLTAGTHDWRIEYYQHVGTASLRVQIAFGVVAPPLSVTDQTTVASGTVIVEDGAPGFFKGGAADRWRDVASGSGGHAFALTNHAFALATYAWARWYPRLPREGSYQVAVYLPANVATTRRARYWIAHAQAFDFASVDQVIYANQWVSLGTYYFSATGSEYVALGDVTYEPLAATVIAVDAVRFTAR